MAKIKNTVIYNYDTVINLDDHLIGSDADTSNKKTKNYRIGDIASKIISQIGLTTENGIVSGDVYWIENLDFGSTIIQYFIVGNYYSAPAQSLITLTPADTSLDRIDSFIVDTTGVLSVLVGVLSANPIARTIDNATQLLVKSVRINANQTTPVGVSDEQVYDENAGEPTEWATTENTSGVRIVLNSTNTPDSGTICIEGTNFNDVDKITFTNTEATNATDISSLNFKLKLKSDPLATATTTFAIVVNMYSGGVAASGTIFIHTGIFGLDTANTTTYQTINVPSTSLFLKEQEIDQIDFIMYGQSDSGAGGFFIDDVRLVFGLDNPVIQNTYLALLDTFDIDYKLKKGFSPIVNAAESGLELERLVHFTDLFESNDIITGGVEHLQNLDYRVWSTGYIINGVTSLVPISGNVTLTAAHATLKRWNVFVINGKKPATGTVTLDTGASGSVDGITVNGIEIMSGAIGSAVLTSSIATDTVTVNGLLYTAVAGVKANNTQFSIDTSDTATAKDLADSISQDTRTGTLNDVIATSTTNTVNMVQTVAGVGGQATTLAESTSGARIVISGATFDAPISFDTDLTTTAFNVAENIKAYTSATNYTATATGAVITIIAYDGGIASNGFVVLSAVTTITSTDVNLSGGTESPIVGVLEGLTAASATKPDIDLNNQVEVGEYILLAGETSPSGVTTTLIYDEDLDGPTEWNKITPFFSGINFADNAVTAFNGSVYTSITAVTGKIRMRWDTVTPVPFDVATGQLIFALLTEEFWANNKIKFGVQIGDSVTESLSDVLEFNKNSILDSLNFDVTALDDWQPISISMNAFAYTGAVIDKIAFIFTDTPAMAIDFIKFQTGVTQNNGGASPEYTLSVIAANKVSLLRNGTPVFNELDLTPYADQTASEVPIVDAGAKFIATEVEGALQEVKTLADGLESGYSRRKAVIDIVDNTAVPPTEVTGDRYILDNTGASHANWDGASALDIVEFNGTTWDATTPLEGWISYLDAQNLDALYVDDGTPAWELRAVAAPIPITYADDTALFAAQGAQLTNYIYEVTDGSGFTDITIGKAWAKYLGTTNGNETDYSYWGESSTDATTINTSDHGAVADAIAKSDGAITISTAILTSATGEFVVGDVGKTIFVGDGAGGSSLPLVTTILTYTSATQVTLNANAGATVSNGYFIYGTDNTVALQAAIDAAGVIATTSGKASVQCEVGTYLVAGAVADAGNGENSQIQWPFASISEEAVNIELLGATQASIPRIHWQETGKHGTVIQSTRISDTYSSGTGLPSVIGGPASYGPQHGGGWAGFNYVGMVIRDITIRQADNPWLTGVDSGWVHNINFNRLQMDTVITGLAATVPTNYASIGVQFPVVNDRGPVVVSNITVKGYYCAFGFGELLNGNRLEGLLCNMLVALTPCFHANYVNFLEDINCIHGFGSLNPSTGIIDVITTNSWIPSAVNLGAGVNISLWTIQDNNGQVSGFNRVEHVKDINSVSKVVGYYSLVEANGTRETDAIIVTGATQHVLQDLFTVSLPASSITVPSIFLNISGFEILTGSVVKGIQSGFGVWLFDQTSDEAIASTVMMPSEWTGYDIYLYWTNNGGGSGDVVWRYDRNIASDGVSFTTSTVTGFARTITAPVSDTLKVTLLEEGVLPTGTIQSIQLARIASDAGDTLANDASLIGVRLLNALPGVPLINIISYWNFDADSLDQVGSNDGADTSMSYSTGKVSNAANFTASTSSQVSVVDDNTLSFGDGSTDVAFSIVCWVKFSSVASTMVIIDKRLSDNTNKEYTMFNEVAPNRIVWRMFDQSTGATRDVETSITVSAGIWYHIAVTFNGTTGKMYIDTVDTSTNNDTGSYTAMENGTGALLFGKDARNTTSSLDGLIDEKAFFDKELSFDEVLAIYNKGIAGLGLT